MRQKLRDRRAGPRAAVGCLLGYSHRQHGAAILGIGTAVDVSRGGLRFVAYEAIPAATSLELKLTILTRPLRIPAARVLRSEPRGDGSFEVAVAFSELDPFACSTIDAYVQRPTWTPAVIRRAA